MIKDGVSYYTVSYLSQTNPDRNYVRQLMDSYDGNDASIDFPVQRIRYALDKAAPGDTIYLRDGLISASTLSQSFNCASGTDESPLTAALMAHFGTEGDRYPVIF